MKGQSQGPANQTHPQTLSKLFDPAVLPAIPQLFSVGMARFTCLEGSGYPVEKM